MTDSRKYTSGPYIVEYLPFTSQDGKEIPNFRISSPGLEGYVAETDENLPAEVQEANAYLLAAALDMLLALERIWSKCSNCQPLTLTDANRIRALIGKAHGRPD
jgi:hypothetical protein